MSQKIYSKILQTGVYASFLAWFLIASAWLFPYTTLKQIFFNILIEILVVFWLAMVVKYPSSRPKKSFITWGIVAWFVALLISIFVGTDFNIGMWSDANRMLGWFDLIHLFFYYLIIITAFKSKKDWQRLFNFSIISADIIVLYSLLKSAPDATNYKNVNLRNNIGTLGNATYVAGLMLFNFYFALIAILSNKDKYSKVGYGLAMILILVGFFYADVSGSQAGLAISLILLALFYAFFGDNKKLKKISLISLGSFVVVISLLFTFRSAPFMANRFGKIFRDFSSTNINLNTRLYAWHAGWQGFLEKPVFGWGYGNFAAPFDRFFDASYYRFTMTEEYFDRAHNNLVDILATAGAVGLLTYLLIFVAVAFYLIKAWRAKTISLAEFGVTVAIFVAYFIHNFVVFDALPNYMLFFIGLAWVYWLANREKFSDEQISTTKESKLQSKEIASWLVAGAVAVFIIFNYNLKFAEAFKRIIKMTDILYSQQGPEAIMAYYKEPFALNTPMDRSGIITALDHISGNSDLIKSLSLEQKKELGDYYIELGKKNLAYNPNNSLNQVILSRFLMTICLETQDAGYCREGISYADKSISNGGQHIPAYIIKQVMQLYLNDVDGAIATLNQALSLYDGYTDIHCHLAQIYLNFKQDEADRNLGREHLKQCLAGGRGEMLKGNFGESFDKEIKAVEDKITEETEQKKSESMAETYSKYLQEGLDYKSQGDMGDVSAYDKSIIAFKKAAEVSEDKVWIPYLNLGNMYKITNDYAQAEANYNKALEISGGDDTIYLAKIDLYQVYAKRSDKEIMDLYQEAFKKVAVGNANLMINYASWLEERGYNEEAIKAYESLSKGMPDNKIYQDKIALLKSRLKK